MDKTETEVIKDISIQLKRIADVLESEINVKMNVGRDEYQGRD